MRRQSLQRERVREGQTVYNRADSDYKSVPKAKMAESDIDLSRYGVETGRDGGRRYELNDGGSVEKDGNTRRAQKLLTGHSRAAPEN
jgi:hypothetical protein